MPRSLAEYRGSDRVGDLLLTGIYLRDMYRPAVRRAERTDLALACMLLAELVLDHHLRITPDGRVVRIGTRPGRDEAAGSVLRDVRAEPTPLPCGQWISFLARDGRSTTLVWRRLVARGVAQEQPRTWWRRRPVFGLEHGAGMAATDWMRVYLPSVVTAGHPVPAAAIVLWHTVGLLDLTGREFEIPPTTADRLDAAALPPGLARLLRSLDEHLLALSAHL